MISIIKISLGFWAAFIASSLFLSTAHAQDLTVFEARLVGYQLSKMVAADQSLRQDLEQAVQSNAGRVQIALTEAKLYATERANLRVFKSIIYTWGWPSAVRFGEVTESNAIYMCDHSDIDLEFQTQCRQLSILAHHVASSE